MGVRVRLAARLALMRVAIEAHHISPISRLYLPCISPVSRLYLAYISPISRLYLALMRVAIEAHSW